jgi:tetratricopeptide (TPR) repeat protein
VLLSAPEQPEALTALGTIRLAAGGEEEAAGLFRRALQADAGQAEALHGLGSIELRRERYEEAAGLFGRALQADERLPFVHVDRARAREALGDPAGALQDLDRAVALDPGHYWTYIDRGRLHLRAGRTQQALEDFSSAVAIDPRNFLAYVYRAGLLDRLERTAEAVQDYETLLRLNPDYGFALQPLAILYAVQGRWSRAAQLFRRAFRAEQPDYALPLLAAVCLRRAGEDGEAASYLGQLELPPDSWQQQVGRYLGDPSASLEMRILDSISRERNLQARQRMLFYVGCQFLGQERLRAGLVYLSEAARLERRELAERRIARALLASYGYSEE